MQQNQNSNLVLSLIKDDLINNKLINGLNTLGLSAGDYHFAPKRNHSQPDRPRYGE